MSAPELQTLEALLSEMDSITIKAKSFLKRLKAAQANVEQQAQGAQREQLSDQVIARLKTKVKSCKKISKN